MKKLRVSTPGKHYGVHLFQGAFYALSGIFATEALARCAAFVVRAGNHERSSMRHGENSGDLRRSMLSVIRN